MIFRTAARLIVAVLGLASALLACHLTIKGLHAEVLLNTAEIAARHSDLNLAYRKIQLVTDSGLDNYRALETAALIEWKMGRLGHAQQLYIQALDKRPSWPYGWINLALAYEQTGIYARPFNEVLGIAEELGYHEQGLWTALALLALRLKQTDGVSTETHVFLRKSLQREYDVNGLRLLTHAFKHRYEDELCEALAQKPKIVKWCNDVRYARQRCESEVVMGAKQKAWCDHIYKFWSTYDYAGA